jgi:hypothetical protein
MRNFEDYIPLGDCVHGALYLIYARNGSYGIYREDEKGFELARTKFTSTFIDMEYHWDTGAPYGTCKPRKMVEQAPEFADTTAGKEKKLKYLQSWEEAEEDKLGAVFLDIDGTVIDWQTGKPVANAVETVNQWKRMGIQIILTTRRGNAWPMGSPFCPQETQRMLDGIGLEYDHIVYDIHSPRLVINDEGAEAIHHPASTDWGYPDYPFELDKMYEGEPPAKYGTVATVKGLVKKSYRFFTMDIHRVRSAMELMGYKVDSYTTSKFEVSEGGLNWPPGCDRKVHRLEPISDTRYEFEMEQAKGREADDG